MPFSKSEVIEYLTSKYPLFATKDKCHICYDIIRSILYEIIYENSLIIICHTNDYEIANKNIYTASFYYDDSLIVSWDVNMKIIKNYALVLKDNRAIELLKNILETKNTKSKLDYNFKRSKLTYNTVVTWHPLCECIFRALVFERERTYMKISSVCHCCNIECDRFHIPIFMDIYDFKTKDISHLDEIIYSLQMFNKLFCKDIINIIKGFLIKS